MTAIIDDNLSVAFMGRNSLGGGEERAACENGVEKRLKVSKGFKLRAEGEENMGI